MVQSRLTFDVSSAWCFVRQVVVHEPGKPRRLDGTAFESATYQHHARACYLAITNVCKAEYFEHVLTVIKGHLVCNDAACTHAVCVDVDEDTGGWRLSRPGCAPNPREGEWSGEQTDIALGPITACARRRTSADWPLLVDMFFCFWHDQGAFVKTAARKTGANHDARALALIWMGFRYLFTEDAGQLQLRAQRWKARVLPMMTSDEAEQEELWSFLYSTRLKDDLVIADNARGRSHCWRERAHLYPQAPATNNCTENLFRHRLFQDTGRLLYNPFTLVESIVGPTFQHPREREHSLGSRSIYNEMCAHNTGADTFRLNRPGVMRTMMAAATLINNGVEATELPFVVSVSHRLAFYANITDRSQESKSGCSHYGDVQALFEGLVAQDCHSEFEGASDRSSEGRHNVYVRESHPTVQRDMQMTMHHDGYMAEVGRHVFAALQVAGLQTPSVADMWVAVAGAREQAIVDIVECRRRLKLSRLVLPPRYHSLGARARATWLAREISMRRLPGTRGPMAWDAGATAEDVDAGLDAHGGSSASPTRGRRGVAAGGTARGDAHRPTLGILPVQNTRKGSRQVIPRSVKEAKTSMLSRAVAAAIAKEQEESGASADADAADAADEDAVVVATRPRAEWFTRMRAPVSVERRLASMVGDTSVNQNDYPHTQQSVSGEETEHEHESDADHEPSGLAAVVGGYAELMDGPPDELDLSAMHDDATAVQRHQFALDAERERRIAMDVDADALRPRPKPKPKKRRRTSTPGPAKKATNNRRSRTAPRGRGGVGRRASGRAGGGGRGRGRSTRAGSAGRGSGGFDGAGISEFD